MKAAPSREAPRQAVEIDLASYLDILLRRRWIVLSVWAIMMLASVVVTYTTRPVYEASALLVIEKERGGGSGVSAQGAMVENSNDDYYQTQYKLFQSRSLTQKVYERLKLDGHEEFAQPHGLQKLQAALAVSPVARSRLLYVRASSHDPQMAARIANALSEAFVSQNLSNQLFIAKDVLQALQAEESTSARRVYETLPAVVNNQLIQSLKGEYSKLESQHAEMSQRFTPKFPAMISLKSNMESLARQIQAETDRAVQSVKSGLSGQLQGNNVRIIDPAEVPQGPVKPQKSKNFLLGFLGGLIAGMIAAYVVEMLDQSVRTQHDVEEKLRLPFLGAIPLYALKPSASVFETLVGKETSLTSESFRNLRTMVDFAGVADKVNLLLVASAVQEEGKTYVASNLAVVFAQLGEEVLLIDGDLRRPKLHTNFRLSRRRGLSDFLATGTKVEEAGELLQETEIPGLKVLGCGTRPPNPSELLNTPRIGALLAWAKSRFQRVIVDCTPMFPINDTLLWGRHIGSAVFISRYGKTRAPLIQNACQKLQAGGVKILGVVINAAKPGGLAYAGYGYYDQYYHKYYQEAETSAVS